MPKDRIADVVGLVKKAGILRPRDLQSHGIPRLYLRMAADEGSIMRVCLFVGVALYGWSMILLLERFRPVHPVRVHALQPQQEETT